MGARRASRSAATDGAVRWRPALHHRVLTFLLLAAASCTPAALGSTVLLNADPSAIGSGSTVANFRYRVSNTNWDQSIANSSNIRSSSIVERRGIGNHNQLNNAAFDFSLSYVAGTGYTLRLQHGGGGAPTKTDSLLSWTAPHGGISPLRSFRTIEISATAAQLPGNIESGSFSVTNLAFAGAGLTNAGALSDMLASSTGATFLQQYISSTTDLSTFNWTLTGRVVASFVYKPGFTSPGGSLDERLRLNIKTSDAGLIPSPGAAAVLALAGLAALRRRR